MIKKIIFCVVIVLLVSGCSPSNTERPTTTGFLSTPQFPPDLVDPSLGVCGDNKCDGPENASNCPQDCGGNREFSTQPATIEDIPPLYFFYVIHTHAAGDWHPYEDPDLTQLNRQSADNVIAAIDEIREVLDRYGVKGTWEVVYGTARGVCTYQGADHIFTQLQNTGHEIAVHAHSTEFIDDTFNNLVDDCGITATTSSGFLLDAYAAGYSGAQGAVTLAIQQAVDLGMHVGTENLTPSDDKNPFGEVCEEIIGDGNDMWSRTGNLMYPWKPDYENLNICEHNPDGDMTFVDHVSITWTILPGEPGPADVLSDQNFDQLQVMFDAALDYMADERPDRVAVWGFVTHITEYAIGNQAENPPHPEALAALDRFLAYVDTQRIAGKVIYATASEIAEAAFGR